TNPIRRSMEKDPRDRYQSATELAGALERALASLPPAPSSSGRPRTPPPRPAPDDLETHAAASASDPVQATNPAAGPTRIDAARTAPASDKGGLPGAA